MKLNLQEHQQEAYDNVTKLFKEGNKAIVIFPTGCGKSFVSLKLMEDNRNANVLFVSPSKPIRNQMYDYIIKYLSTEEAEEKIRVEELRKGRKLHREEKVKIIFPGFETVLYQTIISESKRAKNILDKLSPDFIICEEAHHMKTIDDDARKEKSEEEIQAELQKEANVWGTRMQKFIKNNPQAKVLGLTATPERGDGVNVAIRFFDGKVASEISLIEALTSDTIPIKALDYVPCEYTLMNEIDEESVQEQIEKYKITNPQKVRELQEKLDELRKIAESGKGIPDLFTEHLTSDEAKSMGRDKGKYIIFCDNIEDMKEKMTKAKEWFAGIDSNPEIYSVSSKQKDNEQQIKDFENSDSNHIKLLFL